MTQLGDEDKRLRTLLCVNLVLSICGDLKGELNRNNLVYRLLDKLENQAMEFERVFPDLVDHPDQDDILGFFSEVDEAYERLYAKVQQRRRGDGVCDHQDKETGT